HSHDLYLVLHDPDGNLVNAPAHKEIIDALILWSSTRNFGLLPFFSSISFNTLGNIQDVSIMAGSIRRRGIVPQTLNDQYNALAPIVEQYFPSTNNSSYQPLSTARGNIPAIVLAHTFIGLLICEEANRGDRWFCRMVINNEKRTTNLGAAMPLAYFATRIFPWGVEFNTSTARKLTL
ncbi:MAG: hypothetical protein ABUL44_04975, partial [Flavobacterium sp.]